MVKIRVKTNIVFGIIAILAGTLLLLVIPSQIKVPDYIKEAMNGTVVPYVIAFFMIFIGVATIITSIITKKYGEKVFNLSKELKCLLYLLSIVVYIVIAKYLSFLISALLFGVYSLWIMKCRDWKKYLILAVTTTVFVLVFKFGLSVNFGGLLGV